LKITYTSFFPLKARLPILLRIGVINNYVLICPALFQNGKVVLFVLEKPRVRFEKNDFMKQIGRIGRVLYAVAISGIGLLQLYLGSFVGTISPVWPDLFPGYRFLVYLLSAGMVGAGFMLLAGKAIRWVAILLGFILLVCAVFDQVPFLYLVVPYKQTNLGVWDSALKELALAGGAFLLSGLKPQPANTAEQSDFTFWPFAGTLFFSVTMICYGCAHYLYRAPTAALVPGWIPWPLFWVFLAGTVLIAAGLAIMLDVMKKPASLVLGSMIFLRFGVIHLPAVFVYGMENNGSEISAALSALAFSGIAFLIMAQTDGLV